MVIMGKRFGCLLRQIRLDAGWSLGKLAEEIGVTRGFLSAVELGLRPPITLDRIRQVAGLLNVDPVPLVTAASADRGAFVIPARPDDHDAMMALAMLALHADGLSQRQWHRIRVIIEMIW